MSTRKLGDNPNTMSERVTCATRQRSLYNASIIKEIHRNIETNTCSTDGSLKPAVIKIVAENNLLGRHISQYNLDI